MSWPSSSAGMQMRLVKLRSDVLPERARVAVIDHRTEGVAIGRDRSYTARIRIPSMEVSKHHACLFVFNDGRFGISDTGSTHGTFVAKRGSSHFERLSMPKKASAPMSLGHLDIVRLGMGANEFEVHLHHPSTGWSCEACCLDERGESEIHLEEKQPSSGTTNSARTSREQPQQQQGTVAPKHGYGFGDRKLESESVRRQTMSQLRSRHLGAEGSSTNADRATATATATALSTPAVAAGESKTNNYVDRAAQRRALVGGAPTTAATQHMPRSVEPARTAAAERTPKTRTTSEDPLRSDNRGYQLYAGMVQHGTPAPHRGAVVVAQGVEGRAGLGSKRLLQIDEVADRASAHGHGHQDARERQRRRYEDSLARSS